MQEYRIFAYEDRTEWHNLEGQLHRLGNLPAIEHINGSKTYWVEDQRHRTDGPAVEWSDGSKVYFVEGIEMSEDEFNRRNEVKEMSVSDIIKELGYEIKVVE